MTRVNVITWQDGCTITRKMGALQTALMKYQMYAAPREDGRWGVGSLGGDSDVIVCAIELRDRLNQIIEKSNNAQKRVQP